MERALIKQLGLTEKQAYIRLWQSLLGGGFYLKRIIALILVLCLLLFNIFAMVACAPEVSEIPNDDDESTALPDDDDDGDNDGDVPGGSPITIITPDFETDGRVTEKFSEIDYAAVDMEGLYESFESVITLIENGDADFSEQLQAVLSLEDYYSDFKTMYTLSEIYYYKNLQDTEWSERYNFYSTESPKFNQAIEKLYIAAAKSPYAEQFEDEYFGEGLAEKYAKGGRYTDEVVELMTSEAGIKNEYYAIGEDTVKITFNGKTDTYENIMRELLSLYESGKLIQGVYDDYREDCYKNFIKQRKAVQTDIYVRLVNTRKDIAVALGYDSYLDIAYEDMGYDYTPEEYLKFVGEVVNSIIPVYDALVYEINSASLKLTALNRVKLINTMYEVLYGIDERFANIYGYMLGNELYDVSEYNDNRFGGSFTTYITGNSSPYLFVTTEGTVIDYSTLAHEFGHFVDGYVNYGGTSSLELAEVCSQGLEFLALSRLDEKLGQTTYNALKNNMILSALETVIYQSMYALFEHYVYQLDCAVVDGEMLDDLAKRAVSETLGNSTSITIYPSKIDCSSLLVTHLVIAPMYVQSYSTSIIPALEIFLDEEKEIGSGLGEYLTIIYRTENYSFSEALQLAGLTSPFDKGALSGIADGIYYNMIGRHYITDSPDNSNAA